MAPPAPVEPVKALVAILWSDESTLATALSVIRETWGEIDFIGPDRLFDVTDYYDREMGRRPLRRLVSLERLVPPESLAAMKLIANTLEDRLASPNGRLVNLDVGYLDHAKIVLGSFKFAGQKIHLADGVYADLIARYRDGRYQPFDWTFPDFRDGRYDLELHEIRERYRAQRRALAVGGGL